MSKYTYILKIVRKKCKKSEVLRLRLGIMFASAFAFFFYAFVRLVATVHALCMNNSRKV